MHLLGEAAAQRCRDRLVEQCRDDLGVAEGGIIAIEGADVNRGQRRNPSRALNDVRHPTHLADRLDDGTHKEHAALVIVIRRTVHLQLIDATAGKIILVIDEIDLEMGLLQGCHLDDQRVIGIIDDDIHAGQTDHLVQLVTALGYHTILGHERAFLDALFLDTLW